MTEHETRVAAAMAEMGMTEMPQGAEWFATHRRECVCGHTHIVQAVAVVEAHCRGEVEAVNTCGECHAAAGTGPVCTWEPPKG